MNLLLYWLVRGLMALLQALPLKVVGQLGRVGGLLWWTLDFKHSKLVLTSLAHAFPEKTRSEVRAIARETFRRIAENGFAAVKTASMSHDEIDAVVQISGLEKIPRYVGPGGPANCIGAIGHFGNFELYTILGSHADGWKGAATYRGMNQPGFNKIVQQMRTRSGCLFFERRTEAGALKEALSKGGLLLGLLSDQRPGKGGVVVPFLGRDCGTTTAPAVFALRYDAPLFPMICYRAGLGRWRIEIGDEIPLRENGHPRSMEAIMTDVNRAFEAAIRRDPANWFWVHDRWKRRKIRSADVPAGGPEGEPGFPSA